MCVHVAMIIASYLGGSGFKPEPSLAVVTDFCGCSHPVKKVPEDYLRLSNGHFFRNVFASFPEHSIMQG
jgi:hypothetical protein